MDESAEHRVLQPHEEKGCEVATERPAKEARSDRETETYVVRDLSWELARCLDTQSHSASASPTPSTPSSKRRAR